MLLGNESWAVLEEECGLSDLAEAQATIVVGPPILATKLGSRMRTWVPATLCVAVFLAVSTVYNVRVPLYEAPDEIAHARYITIIAEEGRLPRFETIAEYESWQPPLYYVIGAGTLKVLGLESPQGLEWNPSFRFNSAVPAERVNWVHTSDEDFPYSEPVLAVHVLRGISTLFGAGTIVFIYLTAALIFPRRRLLSFTAAATASLIPQFAFISAAASNDPPSYFFAAATVYLGLRHLRDGGMVWLVLAALAISLGALTKLSTLVIVGVVPFAAVLLQSNSWRQKASQLAILAVLPLTLAGWFYLRSMILWGAVFPDRLFEGAMNPHPIWHPDYRYVFLGHLRETFWYAGGPTTIRLAPVIYDALNIIALLALGGVIVTLVSRRLTNFEKWGVILLSALPVMALVMVLYVSIKIDFQPQGRYLFGAMPAFAVLIPVGLSALFSPYSRRDHPAMLAAPALLLVLNVYIFTRILPQHY